MRATRLFLLMLLCVIARAAEEQAAGDAVKVKLLVRGPTVTPFVCGALR